MSVRDQFPFFTNNELVYLDNAATSQKPQTVIDAICDFYQSHNSNVHRSSFQVANTLTNKYELTRTNVAKFINANAANNIVWTKGTTESINLVAYAWGEQNIEADDHIVVLSSEHHANYVPWQQLALRKNAQFHTVNLTKQGNLDTEHFSELMKLKPKLVAVQHCSNALGNIQPITDLVAQAKAAKATVLVDGAQAVAHVNVDVQQIDCDFYVFSGHKMYGPTGIGVVYIHDRIKTELSPFHFGGEMIQTVSKQSTTFRDIPYCLESGTPNISGVLGLNAAIEFLQSEAVQSFKHQEKELYRYLVNRLNSIDKITLFGDLENNIGVASFIVEGESAADVGAMLDQQSIAVRVGHHCAMPLMAELGINGTIRVSLGIYNDKNDVDKFITALIKTIDMLDF